MATNSSSDADAPAPQVNAAGSDGSHPLKFSQKTVDIGFFVGLALAVSCLAIAAYYLISYQTFAEAALSSTTGSNPPRGETIAIHLYLARVLLQSCGLATGMAFGFLGFALFLLGVSGNMDASAGSGNVAVQVARISPGAFVMLCSTILVGICAVTEIPADVRGGRGARPAEAEQEANASTGDDANAFGPLSLDPDENEVDMSVPRGSQPARVTDRTAQ